MDKLVNIDLFNPFRLWFIVVLITGVDLLGYLLERLLGRKSGWLLTSLVGGFVSSTATTISIAQESKEVKNPKALVAGAVFANMVSFLPVAFLLITLNSRLFIAFFPILLVVFLVSLVIGLYYFHFSKHGRGTDVDEKKITRTHKIFDLVSALKFVGLFLIINIVSKIALTYFGDTGFLVTTALGALTGLDAVVINIAQLAGNQVNFDLGIWALILANAVNLGAKIVYSFLQGSRAFAFQLLVSMTIIIVATLIAGFISPA